MVLPDTLYRVFLDTGNAITDFKERRHSFLVSQMFVIGFL